MAKVTWLTLVGIPDRLIPTVLLLLLFLLAWPLFARLIELLMSPSRPQKTKLELVWIPLLVPSKKVSVLRLKLRLLAE